MKRAAKITAKLYAVLPYLAVLWIFLVSAAQIFAEPIASLQPHNYVNDFAGVLDASTQARLNALCQQVDQKAHAQIAVVTVKTLDGQDIDEYTHALYQKWGVGAKKTDRGVLILLAIQDRKRSIHTGYGVEPILPDGKVGGFGREAVPLLQSGDYNGAVTLLTMRVASVIAQDAGVTLDNQPRVAAPRRRPAPGGAGAVLFVIFILFFVVFPILRAIFRGGGPRGGSGFWSGLLWGMLFSNLGGRGGYGGGGFGGGGFGGGGGGFGGFGGGSSGGGGASGSW
jgi:uncharacterized protein